MSNGRPSQRDPQYMIEAPTQEPTVPARITPRMLNCPWVWAR